MTTEAQFGERARTFANDLPRLRALTSQPAAAQPDLARVALALDRLTDRIEASETRTGLAVSGVEHSVRQALARIETAERAQLAVSAQLDEALAASAAEHGRHAERLNRLESEPAGPRSSEALRVLESRIAHAQPDAVIEEVLLRLGDRLAVAEARTAEALDQLEGSLGELDARLARVEQGEPGGPNLQALAQVLTHRVEAVRAEVAEKLEAATGGQVEARLADMADYVRAAEVRSTRAVEELGRQVLTMAEAVGRKLSDVDQRSADAIDQVGSEVARIAGAVEQRLARSEHAQAEAFDRFSAEVARVTELLAGRPAPVETALAAPPEPEPEVVEAPDLAEEAETLAEQFAAPAAEAPPPPSPRPPVSVSRGWVAAAGPAAWLSGPRAAAPPEPEPEAPASEPEAPAAWLQAGTVLGPPPEPEPEPMAAFGPELFSRAESEAEATEAAAESETIDAAWRRLDLHVPEPEVPETFAPIPEDDDLFEAARPAMTAGPELSTREVIERARAAARAAQEAEPVDMRARLNVRGSGRPFGGKRRQNTALQTALMVAGGAAFLSVGAAGLTLMQGAPKDPVAQATLPEHPRAAMALGSPVAPPPAADTVAHTVSPPPVYAQVRADLEAGVPGALAQLIALAESGHPQAENYLGQLYADGEAGLPKDPVQARRFYSLAAENGEPEAMHNLGIVYFRGEGGPQDLVTAAQWFRKAADAGVVESQYNLGLLYQSGNGVPRDMAQARYWLGQAAAKGDTDARRRLAQLTSGAEASAKR